MLKSLLILLLTIIISSCGSGPDYHEIMVNKSVKVYSKDFHDDAENYIFRWEPPIGPTSLPISFDLKNDMLIFTPLIEGNYEIHLSVTDISDKIIADLIFFYKALPETLDVAITKIENKNKIEKNESSIVKPNKIKEQSKKNKKHSTNNVNRSKKKISTFKKNDASKYTIQVAAWPSLESARIDQIKLIDEGYDAYIQRNYISKTDEIWYRVRVGSFFKKNDAITIKKQLDNLLGIQTWLDIIPTGKK